MSAKKSVDSTTKTISEVHRRLALGAVFGPILFAIIYTILGFLRPEFSQISEPISGLGVGENALAMNASFIFMGMLMFIGVISILQNMIHLDTTTRWICLILLELSPIGMILCGIYTYEETLHFIGFFLACGLPVLSFLVVGLYFRRISPYRKLGNWLIVGSPLTLIFMVLFMTHFDYLNTDVGYAGIIERFLIIEVHAYYVALGWYIFRNKSQSISS